MSKIKLDAYSPLHKTGHTSKGDQRKWNIGDTWYKADYMGYESLSEILISRLLQKSRLELMKFAIELKNYCDCKFVNINI